jgi:hypothetical protein
MASVYRVRTVFTGPAGTPWVSTFHLSADSGNLADDANTLVGTLWENLKGLIKNNITWTTGPFVETLDVATGHPTAITATSSITQTGTTSGDANPPASQGLLKWQTGVFIVGRQVKGETFIPGMTSSSTTNGAPGSSALTTMQSAADTYAAGFAAVPGIYSRVHHQFVPIVGGAPWTKYAVLRSRRD